MLQALFSSARLHCGKRLRRPTLCGAVCLMVLVLVVPPNGLAQYPGVDSDLTEGSMTSVDAKTQASNSASEVTISDSGAPTDTSDSVSPNGQPSYDTSRDNESGWPAEALPEQSHANNQQQRQRYFIEKLRFEFMVRDVIERRTGKPAARNRTAIYLRDLAAELQADQSILTSPTIRGIGRDLAVIETMLDKEIDNLLALVGETPAPQSWYHLPPPPADSRVAAAQKLDALTQKFELLDYAAKVMAVMPNR